MKDPQKLVLHHLRKSQEMTRMLPEKMRIASQNAATRQNMLGQSQSRFSTPEYKRYIAAKTLSSMVYFKT
jgi:hypothetical protein